MPHRRATPATGVHRATTALAEGIGRIDAVRLLARPAPDTPQGRPADCGPPLRM
ncbi:hypothetical protein ACFT9I_39020 [Streptomyces sp. NPDC057137]|uniref:hypothetical protein n=1 Tax=Streptomyces sp. NPDC057137 TaxID=3346030 RepID=UPI003626E39F